MYGFTTENGVQARVQASMLEAVKSLRDEFQSFKKMSTEVEVDQTSTSASKPGTSKQTENLDPTAPPRPRPSSRTYGGELVWSLPSASSRR